MTVMHFEEQISAFMDGALGANEETEFLHILSVSPEKRALLHEYMSLRSMIAADARAVTVPAHLDAAVLGAAGLTMAGGLATGGAAAGTAAGAAAGSAVVGGATAVGSAATTGATSAAGVLAATGWWTTGRILSAVLLGLSLFTAGYFIDDVTNSRNTDSTPPVTELSIPAPPVTETSIPTPTATGTDAGGDAVNGVANQAGGKSYRTVYITRIDTVYLPASGAIVAAEPIVRFDTLYVALSRPVHSDRPITITEAAKAPLHLSLPGRFDVEVQREHLTTWPYIDYQRAGVEREQQHFSIIAGYAFNANHAVGIMLGQKSFAMEYYRIDNDSLYIFQRQPVLFQGAGFYRFSLPLTSGITPEAMLQIGGTDLGPVIGGRLAVRLSPFPLLSVVIGADGSLLAYKYKDKLFTSHRLGLTYGLRYQF